MEMVLELRRQFETLKRKSTEEIDALWHKNVWLKRKLEENKVVLEATEIEKVDPTESNTLTKTKICEAKTLLNSKSRPPTSVNIFGISS